MYQREALCGNLSLSPVPHAPLLPCRCRGRAQRALKHLSVAPPLRCVQEETTSESVDSASSGSQQFKYVLEPGVEKGKWVPVATGEEAAGQVKVMTQAEADALNK